VNTGQLGVHPPVSVDPRLYSIDETGQIGILGSRSERTGALLWPRRLQCPITGGPVSDVDLQTTGTIWSWTFVHQPWPGAVAPNGTPDGYAAGLIDLAGDGPRVVGLLVGDWSTFAVGDQVRAVPLVFVAGDEDKPPRALLAFEPTGGGKQ
jgi:uncharacterized OB-fold protein